MVSKYELTISTGYVPDWGIVEALREIFQNALDNETVNPENKMEWKFENNTISVSNKTSKLPIESLLLGCTTKADNKNTIGKWGEGYKIAFMVLLREGKKVTVYNYGAREVWEVRLVKSKRFNGQLITTVFVDREPVWKKVPDNNLTIEVSGISEDEYHEIVTKNLNLRRESIKSFDNPSRGNIILNEEEKGNIYVKGLFVTHIDELSFGYDFMPNILSLDRDRRMVSDFSISWESSVLWQIAASNDDKMKDKAVELFKQDKLDVRYFGSILYSNEKVIEAITEDFFNTYGLDAIPVMSSEEYEEVKISGTGKPIVVPERFINIIKQSNFVKERETIKTKSLQDKFRDFMDRIESKLTDEELAEFEALINEIDI
ncbi:MAG: hypothetical protein J6A59_13075 [Lachnospiraceae bacterium]|nr:hypothetical protein [Lachnospiraceae bacterium]